MIANFIKVALLIVILIIVFNLQGCAGSLERMKDTDLTQGCSTTEARARLGYFNQEGGADACRVKCTPDLPANYSYTYNNPATGCKASVGTSNE